MMNSYEDTPARKLWLIRLKLAIYDKFAESDVEHWYVTPHTKKIQY